MKNFEESLRQVNAPDLRVETFQRKLRRDLSIAGRDLSLRRWKNACIAACSLSVVLAVALLSSVATPDVATLAEADTSMASDREFIETYYARQGSDVRIQSVDGERLVTIREFTLSDGRQMMVYTESDEGQSTRSAAPMLAMHATTMF